MGVGIKKIVKIAAMSIIINSYTYTQQVFINPVYTTLDGKKEILNSEKLREINKNAMSKYNLNYELTEKLIKVETGFKIEKTDDWISRVGAIGPYQIMPENNNQYWPGIKQYNWNNYEKAYIKYLKTKDYQELQRNRRTHAKELKKRIEQTAGKDKQITIDELVKINQAFHPEINAEIAARMLTDLQRKYKTNEQIFSAWNTGNPQHLEGIRFYKKMNLEAPLAMTRPKDKITEKPIKKYEQRKNEDKYANLKPAALDYTIKKKHEKPIFKKKISNFTRNQINNITSIFRKSRTKDEELIELYEQLERNKEEPKKEKKKR